MPQVASWRAGLEKGLLLSVAAVPARPAPAFAARPWMAVPNGPGGPGQRGAACGALPLPRDTAAGCRAAGSLWRRGRALLERKAGPRPFARMLFAGSPPRGCGSRSSCWRLHSGSPSTLACWKVCPLLNGQVHSEVGETRAASPCPGQVSPLYDGVTSPAFALSLACQEHAKLP